MSRDCCCSDASLAGIQILLASITEQLENFNARVGALLTPLPIVEFDVATLVSTDYQAALEDTHDKKFIQVINHSDGTVYISLNGEDDFFSLSSGSSKTLELGAAYAYWNGDVSVRNSDGDFPAGSGIVEIISYY